MSVHKEQKTGTWRVVYRYTDWTGTRKQTQKRGFKTKREALAWEREQMYKLGSNLDMTFQSFVTLYSEDMKSRLKENTWCTKENIITTKILWSKRCKDKSLIGTVKETIMQVSSSKKWQSQPALDEQGKPMLTTKGKPILRKSYSVLQDDFFNAMRAAGYTDVERGERGSTEEHLTVTQFKVAQEAARLEALVGKVESKEATLHRLEEKTKAQKTVQVSHAEIEQMGKRTLMGKVELTQREATQLKQLAKNGVTAGAEISDLKRQLSDAKKTAWIWKQRYEDLMEKAKDFLAALTKAPELVLDFIQKVLSERTRTDPKQDRTLQKPR